MIGSKSFHTPVIAIELDPFVPLGDVQISVGLDVASWVGTKNLK